MQKYSWKWWIVVIAMVTGSFTAGRFVLLDSAAGLNPGDSVWNRSNPNVGAHATPIQEEQLRLISTATVIYRANGVYEPF